MELAEGVYSLPWRIEQPENVRTFHPSAVEREDGSLVLVDTALPGHLDGLSDALDEHGFALDDVDLVVLTHHDGDHAGALSALLDETDAEVLAHSEEVPFVEGETWPLKTPEDAERYPPARVDVEVVEGVAISTAAGPLRVVETPGHTPGHVSLYLPACRLLLAGDALTADADGVQRPAEGFTPEMDRAMDSVERLADLDVEGVLAFHGGYVPADEEDVAALVE
ncbi:MBL fold metallo-hydrolase [Halospeciosus flavus]|uniref:MBL fold metallo-hydrolase n=1 Tax=Halospeciosus flavus TaxID=3032283 RepID=A0ABD5Z263_9EURY|nr:MBL fold metallo-hydrolase [Halospeciosus flavus]